MPSWANPIEELVSKQLDSGVLIEFMTYLPEEIDSSRHSTLRGIGANRRTQFTSYLKSVSPEVIKYLVTVIEECYKNGPPDEAKSKLVSKVYRCLGSWLPMMDAEHMNLIEPILNSIFNSLRDPNASEFIHDASADTVCGVALICENYEKFQHLTHYLLGQIVSLDVMLHHSIANEDLDKSVNYSRIFTEMAESIVDTIISKYGEEKSQECDLAMKLVDLVIDCVAHYDYEVAEITFHFWYRLSEVVTKKKNEHLLLLFHSFGHRLLRGITKHCQPESDQEGILSTDTDIYDFRLRVRDLVKEFVYIIGAINYVHTNKILPTIQSQLTNLILSNSNSGWEEIEAELYVISSLAAELSADSDLTSTVINIIMSTAYRSSSASQASSVQGDSSQMTQLKNVQPLHPQIMATSCSILGELAEWLNSNPQFLDSVLNYLLTIITNSKEWESKAEPNLRAASSSDDCEKPTLSSTAASALQPIIQSCAAKHLSGNPKLSSIMIQICSNLDAIANENTAHYLLQSCSSMVSAGTEPATQTRAQQEEMIIQLLSPHLGSLKEIIATKSAGSQSSSHGTAAESTKDPCVYLDRIAAIFRSLKLIEGQESINPEHSLLNTAIMNDFWPVISATFNLFISEEFRVIERSCRTLRFVIRCARPHWLLQPVATTIVTLYQSYPKHSCFLYLASILVDEFAGANDIKGITPEEREGLITGLINMLNAFCLPTFHLLTAPNVELRNHPETIDDFFRLCTRFLQKTPEKFLTESMLDSIFNLTIASIRLDHREANLSVTKFLIELIYTSHSANTSKEASQMVASILNNQIGQRLLDSVINCALFHLPSYFVPEMADILWQMLQWNREVQLLYLFNSNYY